MRNSPVSSDTKSADGDGRRSAGKVGRDAPDFLVSFIGGISANEFVVLENNDNIRTGIKG